MLKEFNEKEAGGGWELIMIWHESWVSHTVHGGCEWSRGTQSDVVECVCVCVWLVSEGEKKERVVVVAPLNGELLRKEREPPVSGAVVASLTRLLIPFALFYCCFPPCFCPSFLSIITMLSLSQFQSIHSLPFHSSVQPPLSISVYKYK